MKIKTNIQFLPILLISLAALSAVAAEIKPKQGATFANTFVWDGRELKPKQGATFSNTWVREGNEWKLKQGATFANTWVVTGSVPVPVVAVAALNIQR